MLTSTGPKVLEFQFAGLGRTRKTQADFGAVQILIWRKPLANLAARTVFDPIGMEMENLAQVLVLSSASGGYPGRFEAKQIIRGPNHY